MKTLELGPAPSIESLAVFGHYPPPVTGERLCCMHLISRLRAFGIPVDVCTKGDALTRATNASTAWLILGATGLGFLRDGLLLARQRRVKRLFVYIHNASWRYVLKNRWWSWIVSAGREVVYVVLTEEIARVLRQFGLRASVLRNTVTARELDKLYVTLDSKRILWMAAITAEKGFRTAYAAFLRLKVEDEAWRFDVYGSGLPSIDFPHANFHGTVQGSEKRSAFERGGILVLPSTYESETQPLCLLEALAVGMPVVTSAVGGIPEIVGLGADAAGRFLHCLEASGFAEAIRDVHAARIVFGERARARYEAMFSPEAFDRELRRLLARSN